ncbi:hypothetical protein Tco_1420666 [Tanacetum coccineum]
MDDPNITMEEYIRLEKEKAQRHGRTFNWQSAMFGRVECYEDEDDCFIDFKTEFPAIVFDNTLTADTTLLYAPTVSPPNKNKINFRISLDESDDEDYMMNEGDGNITTWEELVKKFFKKLYPLSCASNYDKMCEDDEEGRDPLEFIPWRNSKFKDHKKVDEITKRALLHTWIEIGTEEGLLNDEVSSDEEWKEHEYGNPPNDSFPKPYLNINNKNHHNENNRDTDKLSGMNLSGAPYFEKINNEQPNEGEPYCPYPKGFWDTAY